MADQDQLCRACRFHRRIPSFVADGFLLSHRTMSKTILITGGARSGKSVIAETKALSFAAHAVYIATAEVSTYIATAHQKHGIGTLLKGRMIEACPALGVTTLLSYHFDHNDATRRMNEKLGFVPMGHLPEIAIVQGVKRGLVISGLRIYPPQPGPSSVTATASAITLS